MLGMFVHFFFCKVSTTSVILVLHLFVRIWIVGCHKCGCTVHNNLMKCFMTIINTVTATQVLEG